MTSRTIQTPAALRRDTRFQACSPGAKWVFGHLCDRREVVAEQGLDVLGTVALIVEGLGDTPREVLAPLLVELERDRGLVTMEPARLVVHTLETAADRQGPRGGKVGAVRQAEYRARKAAESAARVTGNPSPVTSRVTDSVTSLNPSQVVESDGAIRHVTGSVTGDPSLNPSRNGFGDGCDGADAVEPPPSSPPGFSLSPAPPLPLTPSPPSPTDPQRGGEAPAMDLEAVRRLAAFEALEADRRTKEAKRLAAAEKRAARKEAAAAHDAIPLAGTLAHKVYLAIVGDNALRPIVGNPGDFAARMTADGAFPGVDVLATILDGAEYVARNPGEYSDGRAFLRNCLQRARKRAASQPKPAADPTRPGKHLAASAIDPVEDAALAQARLDLDARPRLPLPTLTAHGVAH